MRHSFLVLLVLALGCGETTMGDGGSAGRGGVAGSPGLAGAGGTGGSGAVGGTGGISGCQSPNDCDDGNECTEGVCDAVDRTCSNPRLPDSTTCAAGAGQCVSGTCTGHCELVDCNDGNECTSDACDAENGSCLNPSVAEGTTCQAGGNPGQCATGVCVGLCQGVDCSDGNQCTEGICATADGSCSNLNRPNGTPCDWGSLPLPGRCSSGVCVDAQLCSAVDCGDGNQCTDDVCNPANALSTKPNRTDGTDCAAGSDPGRCTSGVCLGLCEGVICNDANQCTEDVCDPSNGSCPNPAKDDGVPCDLGENPGRCDNGICVGLCVGVVCDDDNECTVDGTCDPQDGLCPTPTPVAENTTCDFGGLPAQCKSGVCAGLCEDKICGPSTCDENCQCIDYGSCDPQRGACPTPKYQPLGTPCVFPNRHWGYCSYGECWY
jgi:hypothetical protein